MNIPHTLYVPNTHIPQEFREELDDCYHLAIYRQGGCITWNKEGKVIRNELAEWVITPVLENILSWNETKYNKEYPRPNI